MNLDNESVPDEAELERKRSELAALAHDLVDLELAVSTLRQEVAAFQAEYLRIVGTSYAVLDDTHARMAKARADRYPDDNALQGAGRQARQRANATATQAEDRTSLDQGPPGDPPAALQTLFRAVALELHPDLAASDDERALRRPWMQRLDAAYRKQDVDSVKALRAECEASRQPPPALEVAGDLVRAWLLGELTTDDYADQTRISGELMQATRQIARVKRRIADIRRTIDDLKASDLHRLYCEYMTGLRSGVSLLDEMAAKLDVQIADVAREDSDARPPGALESRDAGDLFARGLADLDRWRRIAPRPQESRDSEPTATARPAEEARYQFSVEQWDRLRPALDRGFLAVRRELRPGQNLLSEFVRAVRKALIREAGLPKAIARDACVRWNRETRGGRDVEVAETDSDQPGPRPPGPAAAGGTSADGTMGARGAATVPPTRESRHGAADGSQGPGVVRADGAGTPGAEPRHDADGGRSARQVRAVADPQGPVVVPNAGPACGASIGG